MTERCVTWSVRLHLKTDNHDSGTRLDLLTEAQECREDILIRLDFLTSALVVFVRDIELSLVEQRAELLFGGRGLSPTVLGSQRGFIADRVWAKELRHTLS
jgi:hypothetical protein